MLFFIFADGSVDYVVVLAADEEDAAELIFLIFATPATVILFP